MTFKEFTFEPGQENSGSVIKLKESGRIVSPLEDKPVDGSVRDGKSRLHITGKKGETLGLCASLSDDYICCNAHVLRSVSNCPYECSYCFLQSYLNDSAISQIGDTKAIIDEVIEKTEKEPDRFFRIGSWELGDSLAVDPLTHGSAELVEGLAGYKNVLLELKTKSDNVDHLLKLNHGGRTVVSWTLNPQQVIDTDELLTANLERRLCAMRKVVDAGYLVALHFDPMVLYKGYESDYEELVITTATTVPADKVAWISIGSLRFNPDMKKTIETNFPKSLITSAEMVTGPDGKVRYVKPLRVEMYKRMYGYLRKSFGDGPFIYLCMERTDVFEKVFGQAPSSTDHLDYLMNESLYRRFGLEA